MVVQRRPANGENSKSQISPGHFGTRSGLAQHAARTANQTTFKATTLRVKGVGKKWDTDNAEAIMALEALDQSGLWEKYWSLPPLLAL